MPTDLADIKVPEGWKEKPGFFHLQYLGELKTLYKAKENPILVWIAYNYARQLIKKDYDFTIPEWIFEYLDNAAKRLLTIQSSKNSATKIAMAFGLWSQGKGTAFSKAANIQFKYYVVKNILLEKKINSQKTDLEIFNKIAGEIGNGEEVSEITIQNWYYELKDQIKI